MLAVVACWALAPALICERRLRALDAGRGWGLVVGGVLGPLGVAIVNLYISGQCLALRPGPRPPYRTRRAALLRGGEIRFSIGGDLLALACLWAALVTYGILFVGVDAGQQAQADVQKAGRAQPSARPAQAGAVPPSQSPAPPSAQTAEGLSLQALDRRARADAADAGSGELPRMGTPAPAALVAGDSGTTAAAAPLPSAQPAMPVPSAPAPAAGTGAAAGADTTPAKPPVAAGASAAELMRLVVPPALKAHATISGAGSATTLTIACADCTRELGAERLSAASTRGALKAAGVRVVVLINGQDSWTFML